VLRSATVDFDVAGRLKSVQDMFLVEGFNLLMAIKYDQRHYHEARAALNELPMRSEKDLDMISLHNSALTTIEDNPSSAFRKRNFLLTQESPLSETFLNLLPGYCKCEYYSYASDLLTENAELAKTTIGQPMLDFLDAVLMFSASKEEAYRKFNKLCKAKADILRRLTREGEDARRTQDEQQQAQLCLELEATVCELIPILMYQAKVFWDLGNYQLVELLLMKYTDFCMDNRTWKLNLAHTYFMQLAKIQEAIQLYEQPVFGEQDLLEIEAILIANLCIAYVLTDQNGLADALITD
jgi:tetratricopeptide repeat protein 30